MQNPTLILNADYRPIKVVSWTRAVMMLLDERADMVEIYAGKQIRSLHFTLDHPAVVRLRRYVEPKGRVRFSRQNVLARDYYTCCYCGVKPVRKDGSPDLEDLTIDHVIPRASSKHATVVLPWNKRTVGITCWENTVAACSKCNRKKADRTPEQAGMPMKWLPKVPSNVDALRMSLHKHKVPAEWVPYLPKTPNWSDYHSEEQGEFTFGKEAM